MPRIEFVRRRPVGAERQENRGVDFRVWAPDHARVELVIEGGPGARDGRERAITLAAEPEGYFSVFVDEAGPGTRYRYQIEGERFPDPASRWQPDGPHGPSQVIDPSLFPWTDSGWTGPERAGVVLYEIHIGTFTAEGTWRAASEILPELAALGVTVLEILPVADFPGRFGWGYDGVDLYAPTRLYGTPDDMRVFVDRAHALGLGVILDVCYNHVGPEGNYLPRFAASYFSDRYRSEWGASFNFDGDRSGPVREFIVDNAVYWIAEFHLDGLRIDAAQQIFDSSPDPILKVLTRRVRRAAEGRRTLVIGESESQDAYLVRPETRGGVGMDALWNEDFHHVAIAAGTGCFEGYFADYRGTPQEFISAVKYGFVFQGQLNTRQAKRRGSPAFDLEPGQFINYLQNHDQVANTPRGRRLHETMSAGRYRALTALLLLGPGTPLLFQGQEFAASTPFYYFGDQPPEIAETMRQGRLQFLAQFASQATAESRAVAPRPADPETFLHSKLNQAERQSHAGTFRLHRDLLRLRREDPIFRAPRHRGVDGAVLGTEAFVLRFFGETGDDRLFLMNLGPDLHLNPAPEPLLAPPSDATWRVVWSSEDLRYGGAGTPAPEAVDNWHLPAHAAVILASQMRDH